MNFINYKQDDPRWAKKIYNKTSTMSGAGCGPTACAIIASAINPAVTPIDTMKYMQTHGDDKHPSFAIPGNGTAWNGIWNCLRYFGFKNAKEIKTMDEVFRLLKKGYVGVVRFVAGTKGGIRWTDGGHYVAVTGIKEVKGEHLLYMRDPGGRQHIGWYNYEKTMAGLMPNVWLGSIEPPEPVKKPSGKYDYLIPNPTIKLGTESPGVKGLQKFLNWYHPDWKLAVDGKAGVATINALSIFQLTEGLESDGVYGRITRNRAKTYQDPAAAKKKKVEKCIDTSYWQGKISVENWKKVKKTCKYAILRASYTAQNSFSLAKDSTFDTNIKNAYAAGLKLGAYHYSQALSVAEAKKEAEYLVKQLKKHKSKISFHVVCDWEFGGRLNSKAVKGKDCNAIVNAFCDVIKAAGYKPMVYANLSTLNGYITKPKYPVWVAQYADKCSYKKEKAMWQYTSSGKADGISGRVDLSYVYKEA